MHINGLPIPPHNLPIDATVIESTYGGKVRPDFQETLIKYEKTIVHQLTQYDRIIHATFSLDRMQNILFRLIDMKKRGLIEESVQIYVDSTMGAKYIPLYREQSQIADDK